MSTTLLASQRGCLLLADISGYTAFLARSELEHAEDILQSLMRTLLEQVGPPLVVSRIEGDAVLAYAPEGSRLQGQTLVEVIENLYCAFAAAREQTGVAAYAFFTRECIEALGLGDMAAAMQPHAERYEHLGEISGYVYDLRPVWEARRAQLRVAVAPEAAWFTLEADFPVPPALPWDYLNEPELKRRWREADAMQVTGKQGGRTAPGTTHHCMHGETVIPETILDWRPFEQVICESIWPMQAIARYTDELTPREGGTHLTVRVGRPHGTGPLHSLLIRSFYAAMKKKLQADYSRSLSNLRQLIDEGAIAGATG